MHGDFDFYSEERGEEKGESVGEWKDFSPCVFAMNEGWASSFLMSVETQHTIGWEQGEQKKNRKLNKEVSQTSDCCIIFFFLLLFNALVQSMISKNKNIAIFLSKVRLSWDTTIILLLIINTYIIKSIRYGYRGTSARCELALILECVQSVVGVIIQARACGKKSVKQETSLLFFCC